MRTMEQHGLLSNDFWEAPLRAKRGLRALASNLQGGEDVTPISAGVGQYAPEINTKLSKIIKDLNDAFGTSFTKDDKIFLGRVKDNLLENKDLVDKMEHNSKENVKAVFDKFFWQEMGGLLRSDSQLYKKIVDNDKLREKVKSALFDLVYYEYNKKKKLSDKWPKET